MEKMTVRKDGSIKIDHRSERSEKYRWRFQAMFWLMFAVIILFASSMMYANQSVKDTRGKLNKLIFTLYTLDLATDNADRECAPPPMVEDLVKVHRRVTM